jgi:hypothetical protein
MNDWPADPKLDASLRDLVNRELVAARTDAVGLTLRKRARGGRQQLAFAAVAALAVVAVVASLGLREMRSGAAASDQPSASMLAAVQTAPAATPTGTATAPAVKLPTTQPISSAPPSPLFRPAGSMMTQQAVSAGLADGRILFIGGFEQPAGAVRKAEIYDPATGKFTATGSPTVARSDETATTLWDGRVLVVGGLDAVSGKQLDSAELYDPKTGKFTRTGSLNTARQFHTATMLIDGRVLIVGGYNTNSIAEAPVAEAMAYRPVPGSRGTQPVAMTGNQGVLASAEIYDPKTGKFTLTGSLHGGRDHQTATLMVDGRVLIVGGEIDAPVTSAEIYDPTTGKFTLTGSMSSGRWLHTATVLMGGLVLITGGRAADDTIYSTAELYNPKTGKFTRTGSMTTNRQEHTATQLPNGLVLITGGLSGPTMTANATNSAELYDPKTGKFKSAGTMTAARMDQTADLLSDGTVLIAGGTFIGQGGWEPVTTAELYLTQLKPTICSPTTPC